MSVAENIDSYIMWLACKLRNLSEDILYYATYDGSDVTSTESLYRKHMKNAVQFKAGSHLCERYLYGSIALEEFCVHMIDGDLKDFLIDIPNLPNDLVTKYDLVHNSDATVAADEATCNVNIEYDVMDGPKIFSNSSVEDVVGVLIKKFV